MAWPVRYGTVPSGFGMLSEVMYVCAESGGRDTVEQIGKQSQVTITAEHAKKHQCAKSSSATVVVRARTSRTYHEPGKLASKHDGSTGQFPLYSLDEIGNWVHYVLRNWIETAKGFES